MSSPLPTSRTNSCDSSSPPTDTWYASRSPSHDGDHASSVVVPAGSSAVGSTSTRTVPSGSVTRRTACSWPGSRRGAKARPVRPAGGAAARDRPSVAPDRDADAPGVDELLQPCGEGGATGQPGEQLGGQL